MEKSGFHIITPEQAKALLSWRIKKGLTATEVTQDLSFVARSLKEYERSSPPQKAKRRLFNLHELARFYEITFEQLLAGPEVVSSGIIPSFGAALDYAEKLDYKILRNIRDLTSSEGDVESMYQLYRDSLTRHLDDGPGGAFHFMEGKGMSESMVSTRPVADLVVHIASDFKKITFQSPSASLEVESPTLLWDCHCGTPNSVADSSCCPIHSNPDAQDIVDRFSAGTVEIQFMGAKFLWRDSKEFWPPSVDSVFFLKELQRARVFSSGAKSVLDVGSGTGFLGTIIARETKSINRVALSDWLFTPTLFSQLNWTRNMPSRFVSFRVFTEMFTHSIAEIGKKYDLVVCNPPYLPIHRPGADISWESTVAGTDLLCHVIAQGHDIGRRVFVQFSDIAREEAEATAESSGKKLKLLGEKLHAVPFRVGIAFREPGYIEYLLKNRRLIEEPHSRHRYKHEVGTYEVVEA